MTQNVPPENNSNTSLNRYKYLLSTANPQEIEKAHEEAFASMSEEERSQVLLALSQSGENAVSTSPTALAQSATRLEMKKPRTLTQVFSQGLGSGGTILASLVAGFIGSAAWSTVTGGDGFGGRPGLLSRIFGMGNGWGQYMNGGGMARVLGDFNHGPQGGYNYNRPDMHGHGGFQGQGEGRQGGPGPGGFGGGPGGMF
ncbi:hypothetical protein [Rothia amarae]|uniref:hypothetical protein n=1 Tax=Rothia amarae TaxID=169480 RepID=UPI0031CF694B